MFKPGNIFIFIFLISSIGFSQNKTPPFKAGELLKYKINYNKGIPTGKEEHYFANGN